MRVAVKPLSRFLLNKDRLAMEFKLEMLGVFEGDEDSEFGGVGGSIVAVEIVWTGLFAFFKDFRDLLLLDGLVSQRWERGRRSTAYALRATVGDGDGDVGKKDVDDTRFEVISFKNNLCTGRSCSVEHASVTALTTLLADGDKARSFQRVVKELRRW